MTEVSGKLKDWSWDDKPNNQLSNGNLVNFFLNFIFFLSKVIYVTLCYIWSVLYTIVYICELIVDKCLVSDDFVLFMRLLINMLHY